MSTQTTNTQARIKRHQRIRAILSGNAERPRVSVFKSNQHTYAQAIDDKTNRTLASVNDINLKPSKSAAGREGAGSKEKTSFAVGQALGAKLKELGIKSVVFDRGGFKYHGRVKAVAEGLRESGITV